MKKVSFILMALCLFCACSLQKKERQVIDFTADWQFTLADSAADYSATDADVSTWRTLDLPHDWSIEADFSKDYPAGAGGGALPGGIGWYRKTFTADNANKDKKVYIDFDGVYRNSQVWLNGQLLGERPYGYSSFRYDLTPYLRWGEENVIAVKVDNSEQPNSRWYSGSGIYRDVRLTIVNPTHVDLWGTFVTTPKVSEDEATVQIQTTVQSNGEKVLIEHTLYDEAGKKMTSVEAENTEQTLIIKQPKLWSVEAPHLYRLVTTLKQNGKPVDEYETTFGVRWFEFSSDKGFSLNGKPLKINGVCQHHDLGCLGSAVYVRALERQLEILKAAGCNGIRTSHNPPTPELLDLCDRMGFIVMDEAFDIWKRSKSPYDYSLDFSEWYERDLTDLILRDRNHPSVFMWSIGNEVMEQWQGVADQSDDGQTIARQLAEVVKKLDTTRPVVAACNNPSPTNPIFQSGAVDLIGFNYENKSWPDTVFFQNFPNQKLIITESTSGLMSRGYYMMPSDSIRIAPWFKPGEPVTQQCSAYDNCHVPWGSNHETSWKMVKKYDHISGFYIWTGFDYLGEPTPYGFPSRSSYFGFIDLAGFPKDVYYMYQSEWTEDPVLHVFPHWNWTPGQLVDVWAYYNQADEVELFLNDKSLGIKSKQGDELHVFWRIPFEPGTLTAVSRKDGKEVLRKEIQTTGEATAIRLTPDRTLLNAGGKDLSFVTVEVVDNDGIPVPTANNFIQFSIEGAGTIIGTDNGDATDLVSLSKPQRNLFNGKALVVVKAGKKAGKIILKAQADGLKETSVTLNSK
ncbi:beta-galactosidase [Bacteroidia bacterium]|nr:beta-galactosidase [Bacteroidia bacterium]